MGPQYQLPHQQKETASDAEQPEGQQVCRREKEGGGARGTYYGSPGGQTFAAISALPTLILGSKGSPSTHVAVRERVRPTPPHSAARPLGTWTVVHSAGEPWEAWPRGNYTTKVDLLSGGHALAPRRKGPLKPLLPPRESSRAAPMHPSAQRNRVGGVASPHGSTAGAPATHGKHPRW